MEDRLADVRRGQPWLKRGTEPGVVSPVPRPPCRMVLSVHWKDHSKIAVRCRCMIGTWNGRASERFFGYDALGNVTSLTDAVALWEEHRAEQGRNQSDTTEI